MDQRSQPFLHGEVHAHCHPRCILHPIGQAILRAPAAWPGFGFRRQEDRRSSRPKARRMKTAAAILVKTAEPLELWDIAIPKLGPGQVLVEVIFSGACRTQVMEAMG